jgi:tetratricopeptide (TPR) repeat protein
VIHSKADELTRGATTREEKARAIYTYVATHFRYISISLGIGRYQPHAAAEVLSNEYGDCKDKHTLFASLLAAAGIDAYPALMNSARQIDPDVPSPGQFDHVVTALPETAQGGKLVWLDTTTEVAPFGFLMFRLRDKQALVIPSAGSAHLDTTPAEPPFKNFQTYEINATLGDDGVFEGKVQRTFRGDDEVVLRAAFRQVAQAQWKDLAQRISQASGFSGEVSEVEAGAPESTNEPFRITYKYTRKDYPDWTNHRISPPVGFVGFLDAGDKKRTQPFFLAVPQEIIAIARVRLPKGYQPTLLPRADVVRDFAEYHSNYAVKDGVFVTEVHEVIKKAEVPVSALDDYKTFQKAVNDDLNQYTILTQRTGPSYAPAPSVNAEANSLIQQAREAAQMGDIQHATELIEQALKLDDHYRDAWLMLGGLRLAQRRASEGIAAFRKAIDLNPQDTQTYKTLAFAYMSMHRPEGAIATWRELLKQDPSDNEVRAKLAETLMDLKRYSEAVPELEAAVAANRSNAHLQVALGNAYLGAGDMSKAMTVLGNAGDSTLDAEVWNDVAYAFADQKANLPVAQRYAEKAVRSVEDDAAHVQFAELGVEDLNRMSQLAAFWDTLGWVYFQQGEFVKAQRYLEAAWNLEQKSAVGEHLADAYEKQGKKSEANHQLALTHALTDESPPVLRRQEGPRQMSAVEELSELRRTKLGKLPAKSGSAEFFVLLAPGGRVEDFKFISGDEQFRALGKTVASLKFKAPLPDEAPVRLVRRGVLVCTTFGCDFTLFTLDMVHSTK